MKTIEEVYKRLKEDKEIQKWIEKIKSHKWVKVIEEKMSGVRDSRNPSDCSVLLHSDNRRICGSLLLAQICSAYAPQTSHIPRTLCYTSTATPQKQHQKFNRTPEEKSYN